MYVEDGGVEVPCDGSEVDSNTEGNSVITLPRLGLGQRASLELFSPLNLSR